MTDAGASAEGNAGPGNRQSRAERQVQRDREHEEAHHDGHSHGRPPR